jgi:hypothetical protein
MVKIFLEHTGLLVEVVPLEIQELVVELEVLVDLVAVAMVQILVALQSMVSQILAVVAAELLDTRRDLR